MATQTLKQFCATEIKPYPKNAKKHPAKQLLAIARSVKEFGWQQTIVVDKQGVIIAGHGRYEAYKKYVEELDLPEPIIKTADLTAAQANAYRLADNKLNESDWDKDILVEELQRLEKYLFDLTGFSEDVRVKPDPEDEIVPVLPAKTKIKKGDLFVLDNKHVIICGDSTDRQNYETLLGEEKVEVVVSDPPYGVNYAEKNEMLNKVGKGNRNQTKIKNDDAIDDYREWFKLWLANVKDHLRYSFYFFISGKEIHNLINAVKDVGLKYAQDIVWVKNNHVLGRLDYDPKHENILYGWVKHRTMLGHKVTVIDDEEVLRKKSKEDLIKVLNQIRNNENTSVVRFDKPTKSDLHPTIKPVNLLVKFIIDSTEEGEKVLDPFLGSGSTLIACEKLNRVCYGIELDEHYIEVILRRYYEYKDGAKIECVNRKFDAVKELNLDNKK